MRKVNAGIVLLLSVLATGCRHGHEVVFVDVDRITAAHISPSQKDLKLPEPPRSTLFITKKLESLPSVTLKDPSNTPHLNVREMFREEQRKAYEGLHRRLRQFYNSEIQKFRLEQEQTISGKDQAAYKEANDEIRKIFVKWADDRSEPFAKLALVAGFPDPNPQSQPGVRPLRPIEQIRFDMATKLRGDLKVIDDRFDAACNSILASVLDKSSAEQAGLQLKIAQFSNELDRRAELEARAQIRNADSQLQFKLSEPAPVTFPATQETQVQISADSTKDPSPKAPPGGILEGKDDFKRLLENELQIWAALNRYELSSSSKGTRNATDEFQLWKQKHESGPLNSLPTP